MQPNGSQGLMMKQQMDKIHVNPETLKIKSVQVK